jgi:hypothetical protein
MFSIDAWFLQKYFHLPMVESEGEEPVNTELHCPTMCVQKEKKYTFAHALNMSEKILKLVCVGTYFFEEENEDANKGKWQSKTYKFLSNVKIICPNIKDSIETFINLSVVLLVHSIS